MKVGRIILLLFLGLPASPLSAEKINVEDLSAYLNALTTLRAGFTQISSDNSLSTGALFIKRPGRARFEYDPPNNALILAVGGQLAIFDPQGNTEPERYPLSKTPLSLILADKINLAQDRMVTGHEYDGISTILTVQDSDFPERGIIRLVFTGPATQLRQWMILDQNGDQTVVILNDMKTQISLPESLFNIFINREKRKSKN